MVLIRYILYFIGITLLAGLLTQMEIVAPGSLKLQVFTNPSDTLGTSEYSPVEIIQVCILMVCGALFAWVSRYCPSQRPIALPFAGLAALFSIRELDYFLDRQIVENFGQVVVAVIIALLIVYAYRQQRKFRIAWLRIWPSPGLTLLFAGACIVFSFAMLIGQESWWVALLGEDYRRIAKLAAEEFVEVVGYYFWLIGTIEYSYQARAIALRDPQAVAAKRRDGRREKSAWRF